MSVPKRITGRELIEEIQKRPSWLDLPVHILIVNDGDDGGFLNTVELDRFEVSGPDVISLVSEADQSATRPAECTCMNAGIHADWCGIRQGNGDTEGDQ